MSIAQIAQVARVSNATVSRVLNNSKPVSADISARVHRAIQELHIRPELIRRGRRNGTKSIEKSLAIVGFGPDAGSWTENGVMASAVSALTRSAVQVSAGVQLVEMPDAKRLPPLLRQSDIGGALAVVGLCTDSLRLKLLSSALPTVKVLGDESVPLDMDHVTMDNHAIGDLAARYLLRKDVRQLAFVTFTPDRSVSRARARGFFDGVPLTHPVPRAFLWNRSGGAYRDGAYGADPSLAHNLEELAGALVATRKGRLGLFVSTDEEALLLQPLLARLGAIMGDEIVVVSCDNDDTILRSLRPRPASIDIQPVEIAQRAVRRLVGRMKCPDDAPIRILVRPRLVEPS